MENPSNAKGKNHGRQPANLHYIGCVFTMPSGVLQEEYLLNKEQTLKGPVQASDRPPLRSVGSRPFLVQ